jgi:adenosylcobinamide-phosphate synthase
VFYAFYLPGPFVVAAVILDLICGDPEWLPHPVKLIGNGLSFGERFFRTGRSVRDLLGGATLAILVVALSSATTCVVIILSAAISSSLGLLMATLIAWTSLAARSLNDAALAVERDLISGDDDSARREIRSLVGRDPEFLDRDGLIRAAIESVAENTSDGIIAPLLFLCFAGPVGAITYKAINTLDSMIGYRDSRNLYFGKFAARLDDFANLIPARLTAVSISIAASLLNRRGLESLRTFLADAEKHQSPNAGYPEAAMAGALGVELGGDAYYGRELERRPRLGNPDVSADVTTLRTSRMLMYFAAGIALVILLGSRSICTWIWRR